MIQDARPPMTIRRLYRDKMSWKGHERRVPLPKNASVEKFFVDARSVIALSAGEAEFYAFVKGGCVAVRAMRHHDGSGTTYLLKIRTESSASVHVEAREPPTSGFEHFGVRVHLKGDHWTRPLSGWVANAQAAMGSRWRFVLFNPLSL